MKFCIDLLDCMDQHHDETEFWPAVLQFLALLESFPRGIRLLPDAQVVEQHFDMLQRTALHEFKSLKTQALQGLIDDRAADVVLLLSHTLAVKLDENSSGFSWGLRCFHLLSPSDFRSSLQQDVLTPIHVILTDVLSEEAAVKMSHGMDQICEEVGDPSTELAFFYSLANAQRRHPKSNSSSIEGFWLQKNFPALEHYSSTECDYRRIGERSFGFVQCPKHVPAPVGFMLSIATSMILQSLALACWYRFL